MKETYLIFFERMKWSEEGYRKSGVEEVESFDDIEDLIKFIDWRIVVGTIMKVDKLGVESYHEPTFFNGQIALEETWKRSKKNQEDQTNVH